MTHYYYDTCQRLHRIDHYSGSQVVDSREYFFWGPWGYHDGNLFAIYQTDGQGNFKKAKAFRYDKNDNVISIREYGNMTGTSSQPIEMDKRNSFYPAENGAEYCEKNFIYDDFNRLIKEFEPTGKVVEYIYKGASDFVAFKRTLCGQSQQREHFNYDPRYFLIEKMVDHGEGTPQQVTLYTPRDRDGLPLTRDCVLISLVD